MAEQIPNGSTLFIDIGTTPEAVAHALLNHSNLRIVTNNLNVANTLMVKEDFRIILAGGELRSRDGGIIGEATLDFISQFRLDFGILGISGIDSDGSLLEFDYHEVRTKRAISVSAPLRTRATLCWLSTTQNLAVTQWSIWVASAWSMLSTPTRCRLRA
ncbi:hypothetical protein EIMP300_15870 [Escherichia coli]|uniref:DeoR-like transcriptional repressor C-terminal sensor domain-containing protein n=1 Tax=Escherichia coli TaxID=562 RepID=A0A8S0FFK0_ECOLX|nr:hypothetical protein EIMP300_15870 [Escherichia coli]